MDSLLIIHQQPQKSLLLYKMLPCLKSLNWVLWPLAALNVQNCVCMLTFLRDIYISLLSLTRNQNMLIQGFFDSQALQRDYVNIIKSFCDSLGTRLNQINNNKINAL